MTRIKRGYVAKKRRDKIISYTKGFTGSHSKLFIVANQQNMKALTYAYFERKKKKNNFKSLWIKRINSELKNHKLSYSKIVNNMKKNNILLNKKICASILHYDYTTFKKIIYV